MRNTSDNVEIVEALVGAHGFLNTPPRGLIAVSGKLFELPQGVSPPEDVVDEAIFTQWIENIQSRGNVSMASVPSITMRLDSQSRRSHTGGPGTQRQFGLAGNQS